MITYDKIYEYERGVVEGGFNIDNAIAAAITVAFPGKRFITRCNGLMFCACFAEELSDEEQAILAQVVTDYKAGGE